jgi:hypothetical protein
LRKDGGILDRSTKSWTVVVPIKYGFVGNLCV